MQSESRGAEVGVVSAWCHSCARDVAARRTDAGELKCVDCAGCFVELTGAAALEEQGTSSTGSSPEPLADFLAPSAGEDGAPTEMVAGAIQQILSQVLGGASATGPTGASPQRLNNVVGQAPGGLDLLGALAPLLGPVPPGGGGAGSPMMMMAAPGGDRVGASLGDYALGNLSNIIESLVANETANSLTSRPASKAALDRLCTKTAVEQRHIDDGWECAIQKEAFGIGEIATRLPCGHLFLDTAINTWLTDHHSCPVCRHELPVDDAQATASTGATHQHEPGGGDDREPPSGRHVDEHSASLAARPLLQVVDRAARSAVVSPEPLDTVQTDYHQAD